MDGQKWKPCVKSCESGVFVAPARKAHQRASKRFEGETNRKEAMPATIIQLDHSRRGVRSPSGVFFPTVHRITGCSFKEANDGFVPDPDFPYVGYSLTTESSIGIANEAATAITHLDPQLDQGWLIVRRFANIETASAYLDGLYDAEPDLDWSSGRKLWQTPDGIFTLHHREARPNCPDCLLIHFDNVDDASRGPFEECWCHIVSSDGTASANSDILADPAA